MYLQDPYCGVLVPRIQARRDQPSLVDCELCFSTSPGLSELIPLLVNRVSGSTEDSVPMYSASLLVNSSSRSSRWVSTRPTSLLVMVRHKSAFVQRSKANVERQSALLLILTPPTLIPGFDRLHSTMLFWLRRESPCLIRIIHRG